MQALIREYAIVGMDIIRRRWLFFVVPVVAASVLAIAAVKIAPRKFEATSLVLLQSANRAAGQTGGGTGFARDAVLQQIAVLDAWIKSEQVLMGLLPRLVDRSEIDTPEKLYSQIKIFRASLTLELQGSSALSVRLEGGQPEGLARKLEIVVSRLLEGLTGPEQSVFNATQFVSLRRREDVAVAEAALRAAIVEAGLRDAERIKELLKRLTEVQRARLFQERTPSGIAPSPAGPGSDGKDTDAQVESLRRVFLANPKAAFALERAYDAYLRALVRLDALMASERSGSVANTNWVGIFDSPDNLLVVGRPQDPLYGESAAKKLAIAGVLASFGLGFGLVVLLEFLSGRLRLRSDYESVSGLPVVARFSVTEDEAYGPASRG